MSDMKEPLLSVRDLSVAFHQGGETSLAVDHISFDIAKGEVVVIDENFGVRVTDIISPAERVRKLQ